MRMNISFDVEVTNLRNHSEESRNKAARELADLMCDVAVNVSVDGYRIRSVPKKNISFKVEDVDFCLVNPSTNQIWHPEKGMVSAAEGKWFTQEEMLNMDEMDEVEPCVWASRSEMEEVLSTYD